MTRRPSGPLTVKRRRWFAIAGGCGVEIDVCHTPPGRRSIRKTELEFGVVPNFGADQDTVSLQRAALPAELGAVDCVGEPGGEPTGERRSVTVTP